jgi:hypothetical protein
MSKFLNHSDLSKLIKKIGTTAKSQRDNIQLALVSCAYYATFDRNADPAIRLFNAIGGETYKAGMSKWLSLYAPVHFKDGKPMLSDKRQKEMVNSMTTDEFLAEMDNAPAWYEIDAANNTAPNVWDSLAFAEKQAMHLENAASKAEKNGDANLAELLRKAEMVLRKALNTQYDVVEVE